ncbi:MAG: hypothetical protein KGQ59_08785 [Bdellovibrionales bacterium]|nr:hypothetical protein [Bdellovibrionales bacterium]
MSSENPPSDKGGKAHSREAERLARRAASSARVREKIEKDIARQELERQREALVQRLDIAKSGIKALAKESYGEATQSFVTYLALLERAKKVERGRLHPGLFDSKKEMVELVLLTGIYWDLARTYDRMKGKQHAQMRQQYLNQFVVFAKDAPFKPLCAETLRKFLAAEKPLHRSEFKAAYKRIGGTTCFIASALLDVSNVETLPRLRRFRDTVLIRSSSGRRFILFYERNSPAIARKLENGPLILRFIVATLIDFTAWIVGRKSV